MNINFKQIEAFVWVADLGSFRKAAQRLNTTQPNVSTRISNLEESLKVHIMERDAGSVRLTAKGKELLVEARQVMRSAERFIDAAGQSHLVENTIKLGVTELIANTWLRQFLRAVKEKYPQLNIALTVDLSVNLKPLLFSRSIDLAFQNGPFMRSTSGEQTLGIFPFVWVGSPELDIANIPKPSIEEMRAYPLLVHGRETQLFHEVERHFGGTKGQIPNMVPSSSISPCIHMAIEGMGITAVPAAMVRRQVELGQLAPIDYNWVPKSLEFLARYDSTTAPVAVSEIASLAHDLVRESIQRS